jgi:hypothetical protein
MLPELLARCVATFAYDPAEFLGARPGGVAHAPRGEPRQVEIRRKSLAADDFHHRPACCSPQTIPVRVECQSPWNSRWREVHCRLAWLASAVSDPERPRVQAKFLLPPMTV